MAFRRKRPQLNLDFVVNSSGPKSTGRSDESTPGSSNHALLAEGCERQSTKDAARQMGGSGAAARVEWDATDACATERADDAAVKERLPNGRLSQQSG